LISENLAVELRKRIRENGLFESKLRSYLFRAALTMALFALGVAFLFLAENFWLRVADAAFLAFVYGQFGFVGHMAGHGAIGEAKSKWNWNEIIGLSVNFLLSLSRSWWIIQHNQHHDTPNDLEQDPHTQIPVLVFSEKKAWEKKGFWWFLAGYQAFYFVPLLLLEGWGIRVAGIRFLAKRKSIKYPFWEPVLMTAHFAAYFGLLYAAFGVSWHILWFVLVHQGLWGVYYGLVFAPNHKGMLVLSEYEGELDSIRKQVLTTRNIRPTRLLPWVVPYFFGGLNFQIEHHLYPMMPLDNLGKARTIVRSFCQEHSIPYHETGVMRSIWEVLCYLHQTSLPLRRRIRRGSNMEFPA
jgi:fatty acid desaturase